MPVLRSKVDTAGATFAANRQGLLDLLTAHDEQLGEAVAGGGERYIARHRARG
jgi:hypothetical protein